jgi:hypothetical protein
LTIFLIQTTKTVWTPSGHALDFPFAMNGLHLNGGLPLLKKALRVHKAETPCDSFVPKCHINNRLITHPQNQPEIGQSIYFANPKPIAVYLNLLLP